MLEVVNILIEEEDACRLLASQCGNKRLTLTEKGEELEKCILSSSCPRKLLSRADLIAEGKVSN
jgi:hypothetical protein